MPKIIKDLDKKILTAAMTLFEEQGYNGTDMKQIAKAAGTGVGNLYNYYKSKLVLIMEIALCWLEEMVDEVQKISGQNEDLIDFLEELLIFLTEGTYRRTMIMQEVMGSNPEAFADNDKNKKYVEGFFKYMTKVSYIVIDRMKLAHQQGLYNLEFQVKYPERFVGSLLAQVGTLTKYFGTQKEKNREYIRDLIHLIIKPNGGHA